MKDTRLKRKHDNITIYYHESVSGLIPLTIKSLDMASQRVDSSLLGSFKKKPTDLIFMDLEEMDEFSTINDLSGIYSDFDKLIGIHVYEEDVESILAEKETPLFFFQKTILHEYAHVATHRKIEEFSVDYSDFPKWFVEGIAEYVVYHNTTVEYNSFNFDWLSFEELSGYKEWQDARLRDNANPYLQSHFTVKYLLDVYGDQVVVNLMENTKVNDDFYEALKQISGKDIDQLEAEIVSYYE
ncbi:hypothetical protein FS935_01340 [Metabacillus litoralis]|uniref:Uncharacterized protein n=1 Tax=Metabacillus litoralis TaxID=152268 RepID=A0A5C6W4K8_9BACI|nr:peptidase MA family metallohydrolase [Metabacillus litoralis]TXC92866.1 hypothetical protein FS935_01340 [Metabacillus litoralis]